MAQMQDYDQGAQPEHRDAFELMPAGDYVGQIIESDIKDNKNNNGKVMALTFEVLAPTEYKGRKVWQRINVQHSGSPEAQRIGQIELANLKDGLGMSNVRIVDTLQMHNKPVGIRLKVDKSNDPKYPDKNVAADYFPADQFGSEARSAAKAAISKAAAPAPAPSAYTPPPAMPSFAPPATPVPAATTPAPAPAVDPAADNRPVWMRRTANA